MTDHAKLFAKLDLEKAPIRYNENTLIVRYASGINEPLAKDEYFVIMVTDPLYKNGCPRPKSDYFKLQYEWIGIECTSNGRIYISKKYNSRKNGYRGDTMVVRVGDKDRCRILS